MTCLCIQTYIYGTNRYMNRPPIDSSAKFILLCKATMELTPVLPPNDSPIDFDMLDCMVKGTEISITEDKELSLTMPPSVIELIGHESSITFFVDCSRQYLVVNFKSVDRFLTFVLTCVDDTGEMKNIVITNKASFITADRRSAKLPLQIEDGWQFLCIDLEDLLANAFSATFAACKEITVHGSCRISKLYFQSVLYSDVELPKYLRLLNDE